MKMEFEINKQLKKDIYTNLTKESKSVRKLNKIAVGSLILGVVCGFIAKSLFLIMCGIAIFTCVKFFSMRLASRGNEDRMDEKLSIDENTIYYSFRTKYHSAPMSRVLIVIPLQDVKNIQENESNKKIIFHGRISSDYFDDISEYKGQIPDVGNLQEFILYDYYSPSLIDQLKMHNDLVITKEV